MKYLILIYGNPTSREIGESFSDDERAEGYRYYAGLREDLESSGELVVSETLADPSLARQVTVQDGQAVTSDGPFAELTEHLAGFFLVECGSTARAVEIAARIPEATLGLVEVRPVLELTGMEM